MSGTNASRYLPTLTEVVSLDAAVQTGELPVALHVGWTEANPSPLGAVDTASITQNVMGKITPLLEEQMRSVVLPALRQHIEAAVSEAIQQGLLERGNPD
jgi:hypothetical protein